MLVEPLERGTDKDILAVRGQDVYLVYNAVQKIYASVSHDGGKTGDAQGHREYQLHLRLVTAGGGAIDSQGNAYFGWAGYLQNGKPSGPVNLFVTKSTDGGETRTTSRVDVSGSAAAVRLWRWPTGAPR